MRADWAGNPITAEDDATAEAISDFVGGFVSYEERAANVLAAARANPSSMLANAYAGALHLFLETPDAPSLARPWLDRAAANVAGTTERERITLAALAAWADGDMPRAIALGREGVAAYPADLALAKITQYHQFNRGDAPGMLAVGHRVVAGRPDLAHSHGMLAFGFEQCHMLAEAEDAALRAVAIQRREPWAHHALAHIHLTQGRIAEGRAFLEDMADTWTDLNSFMLSHNWWHYALFAISQGDFGAALRAYDERCWGLEKGYSQDQIGAVSLLARLEIAGVDVGDRWEDVGAHLAPRTGDFVNGFLSLQYLYGLARSGRGRAAAEMMDGFRARAETPAEDRAVWAEVVLPAAEGIAAHAAGDWGRAADRLGEALPRLWEAGGSHAQRDLFEQLWLDALIRAGRLVAAQQALERRRGFEPMSVPSNRALAGVYADLGLPGEAGAAEARVRAALAELD